MIRALVGSLLIAGLCVASYPGDQPLLDAITSKNRELLAPWHDMNSTDPAVAETFSPMFLLAYQIISPIRKIQGLLNSAVNSAHLDTHGRYYMLNAFKPDHILKSIRPRRDLITGFLIFAGENATVGVCSSLAIGTMYTHFADISNDKESFSPKKWYLAANMLHFSRQIWPFERVAQTSERLQMDQFIALMTFILAGGADGTLSREQHAAVFLAPLLVPFDVISGGKDVVTWEEWRDVFTGPASIQRFMSLVGNGYHIDEMGLIEADY